MRGGLCHAIHQYAKVKSKYMKIMTYTKNFHVSYTAMSTTCMCEQFQKCCPRIVLNGEIFHEKIMLDYDPGNDKEYIIEVDARYPKEIHKLYSDLLFLPKSMKLDKC